MTPPPPLNYHSPDPGPPRGSPGLFVAGILVGLAMSVVGWFLGFQLTTTFGGLMFACLVALIVAKVVVGVAVDHRMRRRGFLPGILLSIPLVPLLALGTLAVICGVNMRWN